MISSSSISSSSTSVPPLRMGTLNVGLAFQSKLPRIVARCEELLLDFVALQEIGDPALLSKQFSSYQLVYAPGPSHHEAGVGLLLSLRLTHSVRRYHRSTTGRLIGAVIELTHGHQLLLVSAYMPSGLDHQAHHSPSHHTAHALYAEILKWSENIQQVIVMGDLNETLSHWDREPQPAPRVGVSAADSPLHSLVAEGYTDVFRHTHPDAAASPGFTHMIEGARPSRSRIDYIWCSPDIPVASLLQCSVDESLSSISHHRLLWAEILPARDAQPLLSCGTPLLQLRIPNLRAATTQHKSAFINRIERRISAQQLEALNVELHTPDSLDCLASTLTQLVAAESAKSFPLTGAPPLQSVCVIELQKKRQALSKLIKQAERIIKHTQATHTHTPGDCLARNPQWCHQMRQCHSLFPSLMWRCCAWTVHGGDPRAWIQETRVMLNHTRHAIRKEKQRMLRAPVSTYKFGVNGAALVHRMLKSDALPSHLQSVVNAHGALTSSAEELETVMVDHFRNVFAKPAADGVLLPSAPPAMLFEKDSVKPEWFDGLMADVRVDEILESLSDSPLVSSPGEDNVSTGLWKLALQGSDQLGSLVSSLFTGCLAHSFFPSAWKTSIIVPLVKVEGNERTMSNIRPISLQSCLGKLFMKVLAHRLGSIFARFPILNPAQCGFIHGGSTTKCIDELLDAWEHGRKSNIELYTLFYDIAQAYDSVQRDVLLRAMRRLRMPPSFIDLIADSLTGLSSRVRTAFGVSRSFEVLRSLRQGCPLAPLLFVILMDALHDGLEVNPFTGTRAGCVLNFPHGKKVQLSSLGYADDTAILANSLPDLRLLNEWVHYFMRFNSLRLNHSKCELVGRGARGESVTAAAVAAAGVMIEGQPVEPLLHDKPIRYLGLHCRFDGDWSSQHAKSCSMIHLFSRTVSKFKLSVGQASYIFNTFLIPKLELGLRYVSGSQVNEWVAKYDALLVGSIKHVVESPLRLSHSAVALSAGFILPSWLEIAVKVSELFIRMNTVHEGDLWSHLGRLVLARQVGSSVRKRNLVNKDPDNGTRYQRAAAHAVNHLEWEMQLSTNTQHSRTQHLFDRDPVVGVMGSAACTSIRSVQLTGGPTQTAHDCWRGWGADNTHHMIHVYTDGSHAPGGKNGPSSSWAVAVGDEWLDDNFGSVPSDEHLVTPAQVGGATLFGADITITSGIYPAELQAIARALAMFPLACSLHIHSDSQAAIAGIRSYSAQVNSRQRLRMAARPLLQLVHHQLAQRAAAGGVVQFEHVRAHSQSSDIHSVGNRLADYKANTVRVHPQLSTPVTLVQLPLAECEHRMAVTRHGRQVIDDIRRSALAQLRETRLARWQEATPTYAKDGLFACRALLDTSKFVLAHGSKEQQSTFIHIATNSIHCCLQRPAGSLKSVMLPLCCSSCKEELTLLHLTNCPDRVSVAFRARLRSEVLATLSSDASSKQWLDTNKHVELTILLTRLFPPPQNTPVDPHITRVMCGVIATRQVNSAAKLVGLVHPVHGPLLIRGISLLCLTAVQTLFNAQKPRPL